VISYSITLSERIVKVANEAFPEALFQRRLLRNARGGVPTELMSELLFFTLADERQRSGGKLPALNSSADPVERIAKINGIGQNCCQSGARKPGDWTVAIKSPALCQFTKRYAK
jgi:hypothetical protein